MRSGGKSRLPRFISSGSGIHFIRTVYDVLSRSAAGNRMINSSQASGELVPGEDDQLVEPGPRLVATPGTRSRAPFWWPEEIIHDTTNHLSTLTA